MFTEFCPRRRAKRSTGERATAVFVSLVFFLLPLVLHHGYYDVTETKAVCFAALAVLYLAVLAALPLVGERASWLRRRLSAAELCLLLWTLCFLLASLLGGAPRAALLAPDNRWQGMGMALLYALVFFAVSRNAAPSRLALFAAASAYLAVCLLGVLNLLGADPLGLQADLVPFDRGRFVSTVGNINFFGAYVTLLLPLWLALLCRAERRESAAALAALSLLGLWGVMVSRSESAVLGLAAALAVLPLLTGGERRVLRRCALLLPGVVLGMQLFALICRLAGARGFSALTALLLRPVPSLALSLLGLGVYVLLRRGGGDAGKGLRVYGWTLAAAVLAAAVYLLLVNALPALQVSARLEPYVILDDDWGTDRGRIWRCCAELSGSFPWWQKLIGGGSGCLARSSLMRRIFSDAAVDAAHNEYLHILLTCGALGLAAFLGFLGCAVRSARRRGGPLASALLAAFAAYAAQALVNIAQTMTTPFFLLLLAMLAACGRADTAPPAEKRKA